MLTNRAITCKNSPSPTIIVNEHTPTILNYADLHCPCCGHTRSTDTADGWHEYALQLKATKRVAVFLLNTMPRTLDINRQIAPTAPNTAATIPTCGLPFNSPRYTKGRNTKALTNAELAELAMTAMKTSGTCQIQAHCTKCGSAFEFKVSDPNSPTNPTIQTESKPLTYCPYCATKTLTITPYEPEYPKRSTQIWEQLAAIHNLPILAVKAYYEFWQKTSKNPSFTDFITNELMPNIAKELTNVNKNAGSTPYITTNYASPTPKPKKYRIVIKGSK